MSSKGSSKSDSVFFISSSVEVKKYRCENCNKSYFHRQSFHVHKKKCVGEKCHTYTCDGCQVKITSRQDFVRHLRICKHKISSKYKECYFPECRKRFYQETMIIKHLNEVHFQSIDIKKLEFENKKEFLDFKRAEDTSNFMSGVKHRGTNKDNKNGCKFSYYVCNHDIFSCPARFKVKEHTAGNIEAEYVPFHNHPLEPKNLQYQRVSEETSSLKGVPLPKIRYDLVPDDFEISKDYLLDTKETREVSYRVKTASTYHQRDEDATSLSVDKLIEESKILLHKPQGADHMVYGKPFQSACDEETFASGTLHSKPLSTVPASSVDSRSKKILECKRIFEKLIKALDDENIQRNLLTHIHQVAVDLEIKFDSVMAQPHEKG